jgi:predicted AlkP superfamily pyrophosphatase or phosphodiesterase
MTKRLLQSILLILSTAVLARADVSPRHVVLVIWDGMRPDFATAKYAPTLDKLAHEGVRFSNHHSVYPTATDVNGAALATGCYPSRNGLCANLEFRPAINPHQPIDVSDPDSIARGDEVTGGKYLAAPTFPELLRKAGKSVALAGTKSVALLFDRYNQWTVLKMPRRAVTIFAGAPINSLQRDELTKLIGPFADDNKSAIAQRNDFATRALTEFLWRDGVPDFSLLWLSEPDYSQHNFAPGSPQAIAAVKVVDADLATVLSALEKKHARDSTDVLVVSDHGFSTIRRSVDLVALLNSAGFHAGTELSGAPNAGDIVVAGNGGTVLFYVQDHQQQTTQRLIDWLQRRDFAGVIFAHDKMEGTFPLEQIHIATPNAADVVMAFRAYGDNNQFGIRGLIDADWNRAAGEGTHATLGETDVHNTFIAAGPDFRGGVEHKLPTGNIDIAPTILALLGVKPPAEADGRILTGVTRDSQKPVTKRLEASRALDHGSWKQALNAVSVGGITYFEGMSYPTD